MGNKLNFLADGGEMGQIMREKDWSKTPVGNPDTWPQSLRTTLSIILNSKFPMFLFWGKDLICFYNDAYRPSLGKEGKHPDILGGKARESWSEIWDIIGPQTETILSGGEATWHEDQLVPIYRNGKIEDVYWTYSYSPVKDESGDIAGVFITCTETTDNVINLKRLAESKDELKFAIDAADLATWDYYPKTNKLMGSKRLKEWFGLPTKNELALQLAIDAVIENDRSRVNAAIEEALRYESGGSYDITYTIRNKKSGQERIVRAIGQATFNDEKIAYRFNGILQDITKRQKALNRLRSDEERFRELIKTVPVGVALIDIEGYAVKIVNDTALAIWQKTYEESINRPIFEILTEIEAGLDPILKEVIRTKKPQYGMEYPFILERDGIAETGYFNFIFKPVLEKDKVTEIMLVASEVTDSVKARFELEEIERQFKNFVDQSPIAMGILRGHDLNIEMANDALLNTFWRKKRKDVIGKNLLDVFPGLADSKYPEVLRNIIKTGKPKSERDSFAVVEGDDGPQEFYVDYDYLPLRELDDSVTGVIVTTTDATDRFHARKKLENFSEELEKVVEERTQLLNKSNAKLERSVKNLKKSNDELESFAYVSSHDLQEPLRKIQMFSGRILEREKENFSEKGLQDFARITSAADRMRRLIDDLLAFSRTTKDNNAFEKKNLKSILDQVLENLSEKILATHTEITVGELCIAKVIPFQVRQIFQNLIENSIKFVGDDVSPKIEITAKQFKGSEIEGVKLSSRKRYCEITFSDNGIGFEPEHGEKIFEVFQRLHGKLEYQGTGIGLAIVKKIALNHGGEITATGVLGKGATFKLYLPLA